MIEFKRKQGAIRNALNRNDYSLVAMDLIEPSDAVIAQVTSICNERLVYDWLFREMLSGQPYPPSKAKEWIARGRDGWKQNTHFVFAVVDQKGGIAAACDIKSADASWAEVGYWSSSEHCGVMTNAVVELIELARDAGFEYLFAETRKGNTRSQAVLHRSGFELSERKPTRGDHHIVFSINTQRAN